MFDLGLGNVYRTSNEKTFSISAENPEGKKGGGAKASPLKDAPGSDLGKGWKSRPYISIEAGETVTLADIEGEGIIRHIWTTTNPVALRTCVLRMYWDNEKNPSVEVPYGDFFANGHGKIYNVNSLPVSVNPTGGYNCYWPMPFRKSCKITITNDGNENVNHFFYQITYSECDLPEDSAYFHAQWNKSLTRRDNPEHVLLDNINGKGQYVGTFMSWMQFSDGWWGEGEIKFYIDGDKEYPTICGTGTEDYFGGAWGFRDTYSTPFLGYPYCEAGEGKVPKHTLYRWHIMDPIRFEKDLKVTIQALGWWPNGKYQPLTDEIESVSYWYQTEPHGKFPEFPDMSQRWPR